MLTVIKITCTAPTGRLCPLSLGPLALQELLCIFNSSFSLAHCPRIWRVATIIPLLKAGKSPSEVASFRPISLTSCVVKLLERIIADRLYYIAETNNMFSRFQGWSCEDHHPNSSSNGRWIPTMPDAMLRIDTSWLQQSIWYCLERKATAPYAKHWHSSDLHPLDPFFLIDRRGRVQLFNVFSSSHRFTCASAFPVLH